MKHRTTLILDIVKFEGDTDVLSPEMKQFLEFVDEEYYIEDDLLEVGDYVVYNPKLNRAFVVEEDYYKENYIPNNKLLMEQFLIAHHEFEESNRYPHLIDFAFHIRALQRILAYEIK